jgi:hypothetical protein
MAMTTKNLKFQAKEAEGLNHPDIETDTDEPYASTGREYGWSSADAGSDQPVVINFDREATSQGDSVAHGERVAIAISAAEHAFTTQYLADRLTEGGANS